MLRDKRRVIAILVACALLGGAALGYYALMELRGVPLTIAKLKSATNAKMEAEAFEFAVSHTKRYSLTVVDKNGTQLDMRQPWWDKDGLTLRIRWGDHAHEHKIFDNKNVFILMAE